MHALHLTLNVDWWVFVRHVISLMHCKWRIQREEKLLVVGTISNEPVQWCGEKNCVIKRRSGGKPLSDIYARGKLVGKLGGRFRQGFRVALQLCD